MSNVTLHRLYSHYSELPYSLRTLYTAALCILGMGYLFAIFYLYHTYAGRDGKPGLSYNDLIIAYTGTGEGSRIEAALRGPMSSMLPADEASAIITWVHNGADRPTYETFIRPTIDKRCMTCHDGSNPHLVNLGGFDNIKKVTEQDTGTDVFTLVRVSHIHLFGITFIFFIVGLIFSHAYMRPVWLKCAVMALPFISEAIDVLSWYIVKVYHPFAIVTMAAGGMLGVCFALMWVVSIYQMWFSAVPGIVARRQSGEFVVD
jgi:hypothetical protein